ncbi:MAG: signal peptidase II [Syntrophobacter sp.]
MAERWRGKTVTIAVAVFLGVLTLVLLAGSGLRPLTIFALSLFCGGSFGNLLDRITGKGIVVDFLNLAWNDFSPYIFNVADILIVLGGGLFLLSALMGLGRLVTGGKALP